MRKQFSSTDKAQEVGNRDYRANRDTHYYMSKLMPNGHPSPLSLRDISPPRGESPKQFSEVKLFLETGISYHAVSRDGKVAFALDKENAPAFHRALENAVREVGLIHTMQELALSEDKMTALAPMIHRLSIEDTQLNLADFFDKRYDDAQFCEMLSLVNAYINQPVAERYGEHSMLNDILEAKSSFDRSIELSDFFSQHDFSDEQRAAITAMFVGDVTRGQLDSIDETFTAEDIQAYDEILHNALQESDVADFLTAHQNRTLTPVESKLETELTDKEKAFLNGDIVSFMTKSVIASDEIETIGYRLFEDGYNDKFVPNEKAVFGNGLSDVALHDLAHRMQNDEDIRKELSKALLGNQHDFVTKSGNEFTVEYGEYVVIARYGSVERDISYEELGDAFFRLFRDEYDNIVRDRTVEEIKYDFKTEAELSPELNMAALEKWVAHRIQNNIIESDDYHEKFAAIRDVKADEILSGLKAEVVSKIAETYETVDFQSAWDTIGSDDFSDEIDDFITSCVTKSFENVLLENREQSPIHFGLLGNGITVYDTSRTDPETHDYVTVAHISPEGVVKVYDDSISAEDMAKINDEARSVRENFMADWDLLDTTTQYARLYNRADTETMLNIGKETLSTEEKIAKYMPFVFFGEGERPQPEITENRPTVADLSVGDIILYDGKRREVENISEKSIMLKDIDAPDFDGILLGTSDILAYNGWQDDMNAKGFEIISKSNSTPVNNVVADFRAKTEKLFNAMDLCTPTDIEVMATDYVVNILRRNGVQFTEDSIRAVLNGSRARGIERADSDVDVVVEIDTDEREDALFNMLHAESLMFPTQLCKNIPIDINPITPYETGTLETYLPKAEEYLTEKTKKIAAEKTMSPLDHAKNLINDFCAEEYSVEADFSDMSHVDIAYTTDAETELEIQVYADLEKFRMVTEYNGKTVREEQYDSLESMVDQALSNLDFNELAYLSNEERAVGEKSDIEHEEDTPTAETAPDNDFDKPLFADADVIAEIQKNENSSDNRPYWEEPTLEGEQLSLFGDSVPIEPKKSQKQKSEFATGPIVDGVQVYNALAEEIERGTGFVDGKLRVQEYYDEQHQTVRQLADFLKKAYGIGGHSGEGNISLVSTDSKGMMFDFRNGEKFHHSWYNVATMTDARLRDNTYLSAEQQKKYAKMRAESTLTPVESKLDEPHTLAVGDKFRDKRTGEISEVISLSGALSFYKDDCIVQRETGGFVITENIKAEKLFDSSRYEFIGNGNVPEKPEVSDKSPVTADAKQAAVMPKPKNLSQLKKALQVGMEFEIFEHHRPERIGERRVVTGKNTVDFTSKRLDENLYFK